MGLETAGRQVGQEVKDPQSRLLAALAYFLVALSGLFLLAYRRDNRFVRFHALQSILATLAFLVAGLVLRILGNFPLFGFLYLYLFRVYLLALFLYWLFVMVRAYRGAWYKIPYLGEVVERQIL